MAGASNLTLLAVFGLILAAAPFLAEYAVQKQYAPLPEGSGVVISGSSTGIGYHAAISMADAGFTVYAGVRKEKDAEAFRELGKDNLVPVFLDVTSQESVDRAYETVKDDADSRGIKIGAVVNNAGILHVAPLELVEMEKAFQTYDTNLFGVLRLTQKFLPDIRANAGRIINISSIAGFLTVPRAAIYSSTKHALESISDGLRLETAHYGVSVSVIQPGAVKSAIFDKAQQTEQELDLKPEHRELYGHLIKKRSSNVMDKADGPEVTSKAILHALQSTHPRTRYAAANLDGTPAWVVKLIARVLPDRLMDNFLLGII